MFRIIQDHIGDFDRVTMINPTTGENVSVVTSYGGNIVSLMLRKNDELFSIVDANSSYDELIANIYFKSAKLFPFPNRINDGKYIFKGVEYLLPINEKVGNHAIHGFVWDRSFDIISMKSNDSSANLEIEYTYSGTIDGFPFFYKLCVVYTLSPKGLEITTVVTNTGDNDMPMGDGWHPYISLNETVDNLYLEIPAVKRIIVDDRMIPTGDTTLDNEFSEFSEIGDRNFDDGFILENMDIAITKLKSYAKDVIVNIWQESTPDKYNFVQIYIPPNRRSIAIEPMTCKTDAFNNKDGLIVLKPEEEFRGAYGIFLT